jgi:hypothetical protein
MLKLWSERQFNWRCTAVPTKKVVNNHRDGRSMLFRIGDPAYEQNLRDWYLVYTRYVRWHFALCGFMTLIFLALTLFFCITRSYLSAGIGVIMVLSTVVQFKKWKITEKDRVRLDDTAMTHLLSYPALVLKNDRAECARILRAKLLAIAGNSDLCGHDYLAAIAPEIEVRMVARILDKKVHKHAPNFGGF